MCIDFHRRQSVGFRTPAFWRRQLRPTSDVRFSGRGVRRRRVPRSADAALLSKPPRNGRTRSRWPAILAAEWGLGPSRLENSWFQPSLPGFAYQTRLTFHGTDRTAQPFSPFLIVVGFQFSHASKSEAAGLSRLAEAGKGTECNVFFGGDMGAGAGQFLISDTPSAPSDGNTVARLAGRLWTRHV